MMGILSSLKDIQKKKWSPLIFAINVILIFIALGIIIWLGQWFWGKISLIITALTWLWSWNKILFAVVVFLSAITVNLLGKYLLTQLWKGDTEEKSTMRMPEGDALKYVDGVTLNKYTEDGKNYVDAVMIIGGITPVRKVPEEKIQKIDKTVAEVVGSYFIPVISWFFRGMKQ